MQKTRITLKEQFDILGNVLICFVDESEYKTAASRKLALYKDWKQYITA